MPIQPLDLSANTTLTIPQWANTTNKTVHALNVLMANTDIASNTYVNTYSNANNLLLRLKTVDGAGSGLDADLFDGQHGSYYLAASSYTASDVLTKIKTVDGTGSGIDADLLDGQDGTYYRNASNINTGTLADARLPATIDGKTLTNINYANFGSVVATNGYDVSQHLALHGTSYGFSVTASTLNSVSGGAHQWWNGTTNTMTLSSAGLLTATTFSGSGSSLTNLNASNLSSGTVPNARISGAYSGITTLDTSGTITITNAAPIIQFKDNTASAYAGRIRQDANDMYIDGASDGITFAEVMRVELDTSTAYIGSQKVWTAGNDGASSGLDADLLDGQHGTYYRDLANSTGTLPDARLSGAYSGITTLSTTGLLTISNASEALRLSGPAAVDDPFMSFYAGGVRTAYIQHSDGTGTGAGFRLFNDVTDDYLYLSNVNNVDALKFYDSSTATHEVVLTTGNLTKTRVTDAIGYIPADTATSIVAGDGLTGGGTLGASTTLTVGQGTGISVAADTVSVDATVWRDGRLPSAAQITDIIGTVAGMYTGSVESTTTFPVGHVVYIADSGFDAERNATATIRIGSTSGYYTIGGTGSILTGTWRSRGRHSSGGVAQRTA